MCRFSLLPCKTTLNKNVTQSVKQLKAGFCTDTYCSCTLTMAWIAEITEFIYSFPFT